MHPTPDTPVVLVVDDTPEYLSVLGEMLQEHFTVRVANSGPRALELVALAPRPDLVLLDVMMPGMDGHAVLSRLKADPATRDIPVIFVTGLDDPTDEVAGLDLGAADYIVKPLAAPLVRARLRTHLALKRASDELRAKNALLEAEVTRRTQAEHEVRELNAALNARTLALERTVADLETFSYSISHDLRSPLGIISGFAELLQRIEGTRLSEEGQRRLGRILESARRMDETIRDILACMHADRAEVRVRALDLAGMARESIADLAAAHPDTRVVIHPLPEVQADPTMVRQILANLLGNAFKFSARAGAPQVEMGYAPGPDGGPAMLYVRDNGAGFDPSHAGKLFTLFTRLHSQGEFSGTGVGLAIVKRLIERHGGRIEASSVPGQGATFRFTLWAPQDAPASAPQPSTREPG